jgi:hypothetical protein
MRIRDLKFGSVNAWPPAWKARPGRTCPVGEEGTLVGALARLPASVMIRIVYDGAVHDGLLAWDGPPSPQALADVLNRAAGKRIRDVGDLPLPVCV